jgi:hypothetical protein
MRRGVQEQMPDGTALKMGGPVEVSRRPRLLRARRPGMRAALGLLLVGLVLALGISQLVLPVIAARVLRDRVARYGEVQSASVSALPAVELLWGGAESASVRAGRLSITPSELLALLMEARPVSDLTVRAREVRLLDPGFGAGAVSLSDAVLQKRGEEVRVRALLTGAALQAALPSGVGVDLQPGAGGSIGVQASGQLFGFSASVDAQVRAVEGKVLLVPTQSLLSGLARITLFSDPRLQVLAVAARSDPTSTAGGAEEAWELSLRARLR